MKIFMKFEEKQNSKSKIVIVIRSVVTYGGKTEEIEEKF